MTSGSMNLGDLNYPGSYTNTVTYLPAPTLSDLLKKRNVQLTNLLDFSPTIGGTSSFKMGNITAAPVVETHTTFTPATNVDLEANM